MNPRAHRPKAFATVWDISSCFPRHRPAACPFGNRDRHNRPRRRFLPRLRGGRPRHSLFGGLVSPSLSPPIAGWPIPSAGVSGPFAPPALPGFIATTDPSVPGPCIGTLLLMVPATWRSPFASRHRFPRSTHEPRAGLTPSSCRSPLGQSAGTLRAPSQANNWNLISTTSLRFRHFINGPLAFVLPAVT
jgi:hypothetical protein